LCMHKSSMYAHTYTHTQLYTHAHAHAHTFTPLNYTHTHTHMYTHTHTHTHTHINTHTPRTRTHARTHAQACTDAEVSQMGDLMQSLGLVSEPQQQPHRKQLQVQPSSELHMAPHQITSQLTHRVGQYMQVSALCACIICR